MNVQDEERRRIARELHDDIGPYLAAIKISCSTALQEASNGETAALRNSLQLLDQCSAEVRTLSHLLHPPLLEETGLRSAIPWYLEGFRQRSGISVELEMPAHLERLPDAVEIVIFRVLQESITNIHRHSGAKKAKVSLRIEEERALIIVEDFGKGFSPSNGHLPTPGVGVSSLRERMRELGGGLTITSTAGGTRIVADAPCRHLDFSALSSLPSPSS
jgi:two-component system, NarL family, sensor kinase